MAYFGKKMIGKDKHPTRNISMKGVNASFTHDQETGDPIFVRADYPGLRPEDVAIPMLNTNPLRMPLPDFIRWMSRRGRDILESPLTYDETLNNKALSFIYIDPYDGVAVNYGKFEGLVEGV